MIIALFESVVVPAFFYQAQQRFIRLRICVLKTHHRAKPTRIDVVCT